MSLSNTLERVIRLWHPLKKLFINDTEPFPLEVGDNKSGILELYSLIAPVAAIMRDGQHGSLPMNGEIHMALSLLNVTLLSETEPLKVIDHRGNSRVPCPFELPPSPGTAPAGPKTPPSISQLNMKLLLYCLALCYVVHRCSKSPRPHLLARRQKPLPPSRSW